MAAPVILAEATPRQASDGAPVTVRLAGAGAVLPYFYGGVHWRAGLAGQPNVIAALDFEGEQLGGGGVAKAMELRWSPGSSAAIDDVQALYWTDAPIVVRIGPEDVGMPPIDVAGVVLDTRVEGGALVIALAEQIADLKRPVLVDRFAGTGGVEGPAEWADQIKPRAWGRCFNVPGRLIDQANQIWCFGDPARGWLSFDQVRDKGVAPDAAAMTVLAWQGSVAATFAALQAAVAVAGGGVRCPSIACVKWWTEPAGGLHADVFGETAGGYVETAPEIAQRIVSARSAIPFAAGAIAAAAAARPAQCGWRVDNDSMTIADSLSDLLGGVSLSWLIVGGGIEFRRWEWTAPTRVARSEGVTRKRTFKPVVSRKLGYRRNWSPMARGDLADVVLVQDVVYDDGTQLADAIAEAAMRANWSAILNDNGAKPANYADVTATHTAAAITNQGAFATISSAAYGSSLLTGFGQLSALSALNLGSMYLRRTDGTTNLTEAMAITALGTALAIAGQGTGATANSLAGLNPTEGAKLATVDYGATSGLNLVLNPTFADGLNGWTPTAGAFVQATEGRRVVRRTFAQGSGPYHNLTSSGRIKVNGALKISLSVEMQWVSIINPNFSVSLNGYDANGADMGTVFNRFSYLSVTGNPVTLPFRQFSYDATLPAGCAEVKISCNASGDSTGPGALTDIANVQLFRQLNFTVDIGGIGVPEKFASSGDNMIGNAQFMLGPDHLDGWKITAGTGGWVAGVPGDPAPGLLAMTTSGNFSHVDENGGTRYMQLPSVGAGKKVYLDYWSKGPAGASVSCYFWGLDAQSQYAGALAGSGGTFAQSQVWQKFRATLNLSATTAKVYIDPSVSLNGASGTIYFAAPRIGVTEPGATLGTTAGIDLFRADGATPMSQVEVRTPEGTSAAIVNQSDWATYTGISTGGMAGRVTNLAPSGSFASFANITERRITQTTRADGSTSVTEAAIVTNQGIASAVTNQADWATYTGISATGMAGRVTNLSSSGNFASFLNITERRITQTTRADGSTSVTEALIVTNQGVAGAIYGQDWGATASEGAASNVRVPVGANAIVNSSFARGTYGFDCPGQNLQLNLPGRYGKRQVAYINFSSAWGSGGQFADTASFGNAYGSPAKAAQFSMPVKAGDRIAGRVLLGTLRLTARMLVVVTDKDGANLHLPQTNIVVENNGAIDGDNMASVELILDVTAPAAAYAQLLIRAYPTGAADPYLFISEPWLGKLAPGQTVLPPYTHGPADPLSDKTRDNIAGGIDNQGALATLNQAGAGNIAPSAAQALAYEILGSTVVCPVGN